MTARAIAEAAHTHNTLPTIASSGVPGYQTSGTITGMWAPAKTPEAIINRLNQEVVRFLNRPEIKEKLQTLGYLK